MDESIIRWGCGRRPAGRLPLRSYVHLLIAWVNGDTGGIELIGKNMQNALNQEQELHNAFQGLNSPARYLL